MTLGAFHTASQPGTVPRFAGALALLCLLAGAVPAPVRAADGRAFYREAPALAAHVAAGTLPPVAGRLPGNPLLIPVEEAGRYGGTWHQAMIGEADGLLLYRTIGYEPLMRWDAAWRRVVPNVAQAVEVSEDARVFTFRLRPGLRWSDGVPFTAEDVQFWFEDVLGNPDLTPLPPPWMPRAGAGVRLEIPGTDTVRFVFAQPNGLFLPALASGQERRGPTDYPRHALERYHARYNPDGAAAMARAAGLNGWAALFHLKANSFQSLSDLPSLLRRPVPVPAGGLAGPALPPVPMEADDVPVIGAWRVVRYEPGPPPRVVAERNPFYWKVDPAGQQLPYLDRVEVALTDSDDSFLGLLLDGGIDMQARHVVIPQVQDRLPALLADGYRPVAMQPGDSNAVPLMLNLTHPDPGLRALFTRRDVRIALSHAIDRAGIIAGPLNGRGTPAQVAPRPESRFYSERLARQHLDFDPAAAAAGLESAGLGRRTPGGVRMMPDGRPAAFTILVRADRPHQGAAARMVAADWQAAGLDVRVEELDRATLRRRVRANLFDAVIGSGDGGMDPMQEIHGFIPAFDGYSGAPAWERWREAPAADGAMVPPDPVLQQLDLYRRIRETADAERQDRLMRDILAIAAEEFYAIGIAITPGGVGVVRSGFRNVPRSMPESWVYPTPAPTNPAQYYVEGP
ncbi:peptide/nickel transport system substrate-binding protein [Azospirillum fermentarium]|uniref:ABC transporter substrate-binding protein n=1 Tax=Azospirillum fermentarium TaxID=1233114 RepID=UPI0022276581|nr:ABC transporter substrate-binding protein [Azospirillum fermentarium]MCW2247875.1 peptide/nickel transport system substrate-binding protein [Azospirillum fermentarium]